MTRYLSIALFVVLVGCQPKNTATLHIDPSLAALVPAGSVFLAGTNIDAIRDTPVFQRLLSSLPLPLLEKFTRDTGLDPRKDLSEVLSCSNGKQGALLARGRFRTADLEHRLEANGATRSDYKKYRFYGSQGGFIVFLNDSTAVVGPQTALREIIDHQESTVPPVIEELLRSIPANYQTWAVISGGLENLDAEISKNSNLSDVLKALKGVQSATLALDLANGISVVANATCKTDRDAKFVHDLVRAMVGLGRLNTKDNQQEMLKIYDAIKVTQDKNQAHLTADIPEDLTGRFLDFWLKR